MDASPRTIRTVSPAAYKPIGGEFVFIGGGIGPEPALALLEHLDLPMNQREELMRTGLASMPGLATQIARGDLTVTDALASFDSWNALSERVARLPEAGRSFGAFLFGVGALFNASLLEDGSVLEGILQDWTVLREGRIACVRERLAFEEGGYIFLAPDALIAAEQLFPDWIARSTMVMQGLAMGV